MNPILNALLADSNVNDTLKGAILRGMGEPHPAPSAPVIEIDKDALYARELLMDDALEDLHDREVNAHQKQLAWVRQRKLCRPGW